MYVYSRCYTSCLVSSLAVWQEAYLLSKALLVPRRFTMALKWATLGHPQCYNRMVLWRCPWQTDTVWSVCHFVKMNRVDTIFHTLVCTWVVHVYMYMYMQVLSFVRVHVCVCVCEKILTSLLYASSSSDASLSAIPLPPLSLAAWINHLKARNCCLLGWRPMGTWVYYTLHYVGGRNEGKSSYNRC